MVKEIKSQQDFDDLKAESNDKLVVLDCYATWCGPCKVISPKFEGFSLNYTDVAFYKLDVDGQPSIAAELGIRAMPTFCFFKGGKKITEFVGANPPGLEARIKALSEPAAADGEGQKTE